MATIRIQNVYFNDWLTENNRLGTNNDKICTDNSTGNTPNPPQFIWPISPNQSLFMQQGISRSNFNQNSISTLYIRISDSKSCVYIVYHKFDKVTWK